MRNKLNVLNVIARNSLISHLAFLVVVLLDAANVQNVVASNENLAETSRLASFNVFFGVGELQIEFFIKTLISEKNLLTRLHVHVPINRHKKTFVLMAPLQLDYHGLTGERVEERFWINWHRHDD